MNEAPHIGSLNVERANQLVRRGAVFLDRDGTLNHDHGYVGQLSRFEWIEGVQNAILRMNQAGFLVFVVTNQSGVARGFFSEADVEAIHAKMRVDLGRIGARIDDFRVCPFHPEAVVDIYRRDSDWRKPRPGMICDLLRTWTVDLRRSILIGDSPRDVEAARRADLQSRLIQPGERLADLFDEFLASFPVRKPLAN